MGGRRRRQIAASQASRDADSIIDLAEGEAVSLLAEAETQARRYLAEAKEAADRLHRERASIVSDTSESLLAHAQRVKAESRNLLAALEEATRRVS
jgi:vacuolar-type H+-ATPase subunit H